LPCFRFLPLLLFPFHTNINNRHFHAFGTGLPLGVNHKLCRSCLASSTSRFCSGDACLRGTRLMQLQHLHRGVKRRHGVPDVGAGGRFDPLRECCCEFRRRPFEQNGIDIDDVGRFRLFLRPFFISLFTICVGKRKITALE